jgi:hypothetical protein
MVDISVATDQSARHLETLMKVVDLVSRAHIVP